MGDGPSDVRDEDKKPLDLSRLKNETP